MPRSLTVYRLPLAGFCIFFVLSVFAFSVQLTFKELPNIRLPTATKPQPEPESESDSEAGPR